MTVDEGMLSDYLDGRLAPAERKAFEARLAAEPALDRRVRLARALKTSLAVSAPRMPADLKAALKREARSRRAKAAASWLEAAVAAFGASRGTAYGVGAAFAAAALTLALARRAPHARTLPAGSAMTDAAASDGLKELWSEDDGRDGDEG
jgi:anti-sigma factor RsiW